jgi:hypothetical protein
MSQDTRVFNLTRKFRMKRSQALRAIENCACAWVEYGVSVRDLSLREAINARNSQARQREPLPNPELPGLVFEHPVSAIASVRERYALIREANALVM